MAAASEKAGNLSDAKKAYRKAAELDPDNPAYKKRLDTISAAESE